ncbi:flagellar assembly protein A [Clostridium ganghwense]|uniref:FapA family protein n=1 Tax=Clostridium ganghwense TaxID=312089 RepID=A0ABT4CPS1_9CLOT|nr:flagellar assembly protein A [Clostridium ganghwense]MCY6370438.1 FapA family protein [Clostridium ganghwense]
MNKKVFSGKTLEACLELASSQLNISKEDIKYKIIEEKRGLFKRKITISIEFEEKKKEKKENKNGSIRVENGIIIVKNPKEGGQPASIRNSNNITVMVDNVEVNGKKEVYEDSNIEVFFGENTAERRININLSPDKMKAFINIKYIPENIYVVQDSLEVFQLSPERKIAKQIYPEFYTEQEIKEQLNTSGIKFGIIEDNIAKSTKMEEVSNLLIAQGEEVIESIDDKIQINFSTERETEQLEQDNKGRVDYKCIGHVKSVQKGEVLAVRHEGKNGKDGIDVKGTVKRHKVAKKIQLQVGEDCEFKDENTVVASMEGKPSVKGTLFSVHQVHEVKSDVDLKTGNIEFIGDVIIHGSVKEGMQVNAGHDLFINKHVESAKISSKSDMEVRGHVINSTLSSGGEDIIKLNKMKKLEKLNSALVELIKSVEQVKKLNLLGKNVHDGEIIKVLIENKFKHITGICNDYVKLIQGNANNEEIKLASVIKQKLMGFAPISIKHYSELNVLIELINENIQIFRGILAVPVDMKIGYCQDSTLKSSGNIIITGKGEYVSEIIAHESIEFTNPTSVARGGIIKAKNEIKCKKVGSEGGVSTKLIVEPGGNIWVGTAYQNTCFIIGGREYTLDSASKDIHAYLNSENELVVDKFVL